MADRRSSREIQAAVSDLVMKGVKVWRLKRARGTSGAHERATRPERLRTDEISAPGQATRPPHSPSSETPQRKTRPTG
jgi:hypothetical protein